MEVYLQLRSRQHGSSKKWSCGGNLLFASCFSCSFSRKAHVQECTNPAGVQGGGRCRDCMWRGQLSPPNHHLEAQRTRCHPEKRWWGPHFLVSAFPQELSSSLGFHLSQSPKHSSPKSEFRFRYPESTCSFQLLSGDACIYSYIRLRHLIFSPKQKRDFRWTVLLAIFQSQGQTHFPIARKSFTP